MGGEYFYGFVNNKGNQTYRGKLVRVLCYSQESKNDCYNLGLASRHEFCWDEFTDWDHIDVTRHDNEYLGPSISTFEVFNLPYDQADWMRRLNNRKSITQLTLPGSHDAGSAQTEEKPFISADLARCQSFSIITQLLLGIRVFDIRPTRASNNPPGREDSGIWTHHGGSTDQGILGDLITFKGEKLERAVNCVKLFLQAYPSETVIFILSHETNVEYKDVYKNIKDFAGPNFICDWNWQEDKLIESQNFKLNENRFNVEQVRGKLIVINENKTDRHNSDEDAAAHYKGFETDNWDKMKEYLDYCLTKQKRHPEKLDRFVAALTPTVANVVASNSGFTNAGKPEYVAKHHGIPGLMKWLAIDAVRPIGSVETDFFGTAQEVHDYITRIINKNTFDGAELSMVADDKVLELYFDGISVPCNDGTGNYPYSCQVFLPSYVCTVAIKCSDKTSSERNVAGYSAGNSAGFVASTSDEQLLTNSNWKCTSRQNDKWMSPEYNDKDWPAAVCQSPSTLKQISSKAMWIWTANSGLNGTMIDPVVYFRWTRPSGVGLAITADDKVLELYFDGVPVPCNAGSHDWPNSRQVFLPLYVKTIAVKCSDKTYSERNVAGYSPGNSAGFVASTSDEQVLTSTNWKCTPKLNENWMLPQYNDKDWPAAVAWSMPNPTYFNGISKKATWIWTANDGSNGRMIDPVVYFRWTRP